MTTPTTLSREIAPAELPQGNALSGLRPSTALPSAHWAALSPEIYEYTEHQNMLVAGIREPTPPRLRPALDVDR